MNSFLLGRPATDGKGRERYSVRFALWVPNNALLSGTERLSVNQGIVLTLGGRRATIEKRTAFLVLKLTGIESLAASRAVGGQVAAGLIRFCTRKGIAIQFPFPPSEIQRERQGPTFDFREKVIPTEYPTDWALRADGTRTDGGIFADQTYILPEHERIWEYPDFIWVNQRSFSLQDLSSTVEESSQFSLPTSADEGLLCSIHALWAACAQNDRRLRYILLVTALDVLAKDENVAAWTSGLEDVILDVKKTVAAHFENAKKGQESKDSEDAKHPKQKNILRVFEKFSRKLGEIGNPGMADRVRTLMTKTLAAKGGNSSELKGLVKELNAVLGKRGALAHGGGFLKVPTADENERLRALVAAALDARLRLPSTSDVDPK